MALTLLDLLEDSEHLGQPSGRPEELVPEGSDSVL